MFSSAWKCVCLPNNSRGVPCNDIEIIYMLFLKHLNLNKKSLFSNFFLEIETSHEYYVYQK